MNKRKTTGRKAPLEWFPNSTERVHKNGDGQAKGKEEKTGKGWHASIRFFVIDQK